MTPYMDVVGAEEGARLAQLIQRGDRAAEARLARVFCDCVFSMALARTHDRDAAGELMDDVLMAAIVALRHGALRDNSRLGGFIHGTTVNTINAYLRRRRLRPRMVALDEDAPVYDLHNDYEAQDRQRMAQDALAFLGEQDRHILFLSLTEGLKPGEIAARLGLSSVAVRQRKCRALRAIVLYVGGGSTGIKARRMLQR